MTRAPEIDVQAVLDHAPIATLLVGVSGELLYGNQAACSLLGYEAAELVRRTVADITHPDDLEALLLLTDQAVAGVVAGFELEKRLIRADGCTIAAYSRVTLLRDVQGKPAYFIAQVEEMAQRSGLRTSPEQPRETLAGSESASFSLDREWRITRADPAAARLFACGRDELVGRSLHDVAASPGLAPVMRVLQEAMASGQRGSVAEVANPARDAWFALRVYPTAEGLAVYLRDVTARRHLIRELRASEANYRTLVEQLPAAVYLQADDEEETLLYLSPYFYVLSGYSPQDAAPGLGRAAWLAAVHPEDRARIAAENMEIEPDPSASPIVLEYRFLRADGAYIWVREVCVPVRDEAGEISAWQGVMIDITDHKVAEETKARLAAIVESADEAIMSRDTAGHLLSWNRGAERMLGYRAEEVLGEHVAMFMPKEVDVQGTPLMRNPDAPPAQFTSRRRRKDGQVIDVAVSIAPMRDSNGQVIGVASITRDISEQLAADRKLQAALEAAEAGIRAKNLFVAMMSHELRTPLQAVQGYAEFLMQGAQENLTPEQVEDIGYIHQGATRMTRLIEQMLDLSRMEAGHLELKIAAVDLRRTLEQVRQDVARQAEAKGLTLEIDVPDDLPQVRGDEDRLRQILLNLVGNAVKFTEAGHVLVRAEAGRRGVAITVSDSGIGIAANKLDSIFAEFQQASPHLARRYGGAGLGLAIAQRLAEQMGGKITVSSTVGTGSTFTLRLPLPKVSRAAARGGER